MISIEEEKNWQNYVREMRRKPGSVYFQMCQLLRYKQVFYKDRPKFYVQDKKRPYYTIQRQK